MSVTPETTYSARYAASLTPKQRQQWIQNLSDDEIKVLRYDWRFWARPEQIAPLGDWFCWHIRSGRGWGKTRTGAQWIVERARKGFKRLALVGQTKADARDTMIEVEESSILNVSPPWFKPDYQPSKRRLVWPNGATATLFSGDEPDQLRGPQHDSAWVDELSKFKYPKRTWDMLELGLRIGDNPQVVVTNTPRPIPIIKELMADPRTVDVVGSTYDNIANLAPQFIARMMNKYEGTHLGRQELHGEVLEDREGALWKRASMIEAHRVMQHPRLTRVVVAVDPPGGRAECGIVVGGLGEDGDGYIIEDSSLAGSPATWGGAAVTSYHRNAADRIVAEINFGGDMVGHIIRTVDESVAFKTVRASRGKAVRAEPAAALYEQGRVHHVGQFALLEDELCTWVPDEGMKSPNRLDALVWALTELMLGPSPGSWDDVIGLGEIDDFESKWA